MLKDFGLDLKKLRESKNITIAEVSAQTRINPKFIEKIESGIFDFQPDTYIRAFLREYARVINENEEKILGDYNKAKSGFYPKKNVKKDEHTLSIKPVIEPQEEQPRKIEKAPAESIMEKSGDNEEPVKSPRPFKQYDDEEEEEYSNKTWTQKILLGLLILVILAGAYYLYTYLNESGKNDSNVKPKEFNETMEGYEQKINPKTIDSVAIKDSLEALNTSTTVSDSLKLTIVASKDIRIKVYVDEKRIVEEEIPAKDSISIFAKDQFRFSSSGNASVDIYLNGKYLKKPSYLTTNTIKNLIIDKNGIVRE